MKGIENRRSIDEQPYIAGLTPAELATAAQEAQRNGMPAPGVWLLQEYIDRAERDPQGKVPSPEVAFLALDAIRFLKRRKRL